jgi:hypothetical protein
MGNGDGGALGVFSGKELVHAGTVEVTRGIVKGALSNFYNFHTDYLLSTYHLPWQRHEGGQWWND